MHMKIIIIKMKHKMPLIIEACNNENSSFNHEFEDSAVSGAVVVNRL